MSYDLSEIEVVGCYLGKHVGAIVRASCAAFGMRHLTFAETPTDIASALEYKDPDILLVGLHGHDDDAGWTLAKHMRNRYSSPNPYIPIVAISPHAEKRWVMKAINSGFHEFVALPLKPVTLWRAISHSVFIGRPFVSAPSYFGPCRRRRDDPKYDGPDRRSGDFKLNAEDRMQREHKINALMHDDSEQELI